MRIARWIALAYGLVCALALFLIPASLFEWFGIARDPLSVIFAWLLAMPWALLLTLTRFGDWGGLAVIVLGMAANVALILLIGKRLSRRGQP